MTGTPLAAAPAAAFERWGAALDGMRRRDRLVLHADGAAPELPVVATLCAAVADRWTPGQAGAVAGVLGAPPDDTQARIADRIGIAQPTLARALAGARFEALAEAIAWTERG